MSRGNLTFQRLLPLDASSAGQIAEQLPVMGADPPCAQLPVLLMKSLAGLLSSPSKLLRARLINHLSLTEKVLSTHSLLASFGVKRDKCGSQAFDPRLWELQVCSPLCRVVMLWLTCEALVKAGSSERSFLWLRLPRLAQAASPA